MVRALLAAGADPNAKDDEHKSALRYAARFPEVQEVLRQKGAN